MDIEREIELMNHVIANAIIHGGDWEGPYESNTVGLVKAVNNWLREKGIKDKYHVVEDAYNATITTDPFPLYRGEDAEKPYTTQSGNFPVLKIAPIDEKGYAYGRYRNNELDDIE